VRAHSKELLQDHLRKRHSVTKLVALVFTAKYRGKIFVGVIIDQMRGIWTCLCEVGVWAYWMLNLFPPKLSNQC